VHINNHIIYETTIIPYHYPGNLECPAIFQLSAIDKSITPVIALKNILTDKELELVFNAGEMCDNSMSVYVKDYTKRLIWSFPDVGHLESLDINKTSILNFKNEWSKIAISENQFHNNDIMPQAYKSHKVKIDHDSNDIFYIRLQPKMNNFKKMRIQNWFPEDAEFTYIMHNNLKQYLSGNNMFSILFSFIYSSNGSELFVLWALLHRNPFFLNLLFDLGGIDLLKDIISDKHKEGTIDTVNLLYLFNISCNEPISTSFETKQPEENKSEVETKGAPKYIPKFSESMMDFLDILVLICKKGELVQLTPIAKSDLPIVNKIWEILEELFQDKSNREKFDNRYGKQLFSTLKTHR